MKRWMEVFGEDMRTRGVDSVGLRVVGGAHIEAFMIVRQGLKANTSLFLSNVFGVQLLCG